MTYVDEMFDRQFHQWQRAVKVYRFTLPERSRFSAAVLKLVALRLAEYGHYGLGCRPAAGALAADLSVAERNVRAARAFLVEQKVFLPSGAKRYGVTSLDINPEFARQLPRDWPGDDPWGESPG